MGSVASLVSIANGRYIVLDQLLVPIGDLPFGILEGLKQIRLDLIFGNARVVDDQPSSFFEKISADVDSGGFSGVVGILLEGKPQHADLLVRHRMKHGANDPSRESFFLVVVHPDDLFPVCRDFGETKVFAQVNQVEDIFLKTGAAEPDRCFQEFRTDTGIGSYGFSDLINIGPGDFAEGGDRVDG